MVGVITLISTLMVSSSAWAGGISLGATRVIYPADAKQTSLAVNNSDKQARFLIQTWVENEAGNKTDDFIVTPPLFVSKPASENTLRIIYSGGKLPDDRETLYWLNSKAIPSVNRDDIKGKNVLQIAVLARIKIFVRPAGLAEKSADAPQMLTFLRNGNNLTITNPSPFYVTLVNMTIGGKNVNLANKMVAPKSSAQLPLFNEASGVFTYQAINDYGAMTPVAKVQVN
ncbi:fimbria/pilus periplasmic chaperone [Serratia quinivorans]|uniref:fimbria/pilus periplasmic chaperone n=1 Tax=Serratia quinivorans TaxID=137545 RepID=UPI00167A4F75|nr:fimbria/pilus periplasmic chaperone [Serratia quinivorans]